MREKMNAMAPRPVFKMEAGPIGGPGLHAVVGEDSIDVALVPIPHHPGAEKNALGPASSGDTVGTDLAQNCSAGSGRMEITLILTIPTDLSRAVEVLLIAETVLTT